MRYGSKKLEEKSVLDTAARMCAAARTAPKTRGIDFIRTCVLTGEEKEALAQEMDRLAPVLDYPFFTRDAGNIRASQAVVLIGTSYQQRGLNEGCQYCNHTNCAAKRRVRVRQCGPWNCGRFGRIGGRGFPHR